MHFLRRSVLLNTKLNIKENRISSSHEWFKKCLLHENPYLSCTPNTKFINIDNVGSHQTKKKNIFQLHSIVLPIQFFLEVTSINGTYLCLFLKQLKHHTEIKNWPSSYILQLNQYSMNFYIKRLKVFVK